MTADHSHATTATLPTGGREFSHVRASSPKTANGEAEHIGSAPGQRLGPPAPCVQQCEKRFDECLKRSSFPPQCIAERSACYHLCPTDRPPQPAEPAKPARRACVLSEQIPHHDSGVGVFDDGVWKKFHMDIEWKQDSEGCDPACGEYRQFVKGHIFRNNQRFNIGLCDGAKLEEDIWHEDGDAENGTCYGHRERPHKNTDAFSDPDRATGKRYHGTDTPRVPGRPGDEIDVALYFKGQSFDKCLGTFGPIHEWNFVFKGRLPDSQ